MNKLSSEEKAKLASDPCYFGARVLNWHAHPAQEAFLHDSHRIRVGCFGRQSGKSTMVSIQLLHYALYRPGSNVLVIGPTFKKSSIIFDMLKKFVFGSDILSGQVEAIVRSPYGQVRFKNGSIIRCLTGEHDAEQARGETADVVVLEEAAWISEKGYEISILPTLFRSSGPLVVISTPFGKGWFFDLFERGAKGDDAEVKSFRYPSYCNPYLNHKLIDEVYPDRNSFAYRQEVLAEFVDEQAFVFPRSLIEPCLVDDGIALEREAGHAYVMGVDVARLRDKTAVCCLDVSDARIVKVKWFEQFNESTMHAPKDEYWAVAVDRVAAVSSVFDPYRLVLDATGAGNPVLELLTRKVPQTEPYVFSNTQQSPQKYILINQLVLAFQQKRIQIPRSQEDLISQLEYFEYEIGEDAQGRQSGVVKMMAAVGHHDDAVIALALAWSAVPPSDGEVSVSGISHSNERAKESLAQVITTLERLEHNPFSGSAENPFAGVIDPWSGY